MSKGADGRGVTSLSLAFRSQGRGRPVLLLHGLFGAARHWHDIARRLATRCEAITVDLRNHGHSPHAPHMDYGVMVDDVLALLDARGIERTTLVGHSMGGKVAMALALRAPHRVDRLAVIDIAPVAYAHAFAPIAEAAWRLDLTRLRDRGEADARLAECVEVPALRAMLLQNLAHDGAGGWRWRIGWPGIVASLPALLDFPADPAARSSEAEALFLKGGCSDYVDAQGERAIAACFPRARVETIEGAGHWVHAERPTALSRRLEQFLDAASGAQASQAARPAAQSSAPPNNSP